MKIENSLDLLAWECKIKAHVLLECAKTKLPNIAVFETYRTVARELSLITKPGKAVSWLKNASLSKHCKGLAIDRVFMKNWQPTRSGDYATLQRLATMCGLTRISQEACHTQDNWLTIRQQMAKNSARYNASTYSGEQQQLHIVNECFKKHWYI